MSDRRADAAFLKTCRTGPQATGPTRVETDSLGSKEIPADAYFTALIPHIGYGAASTLANEALATNANIADLVVSSGLMTRERVAELLTPEHLTRA